MYKRKNQILSSIENLSNYIDDYDIYNSTLLSILNSSTIEKEAYEITVYQYRPDLIARDYYGSENYLGLLMMQCGAGLSDYTKGTILNLIPKNKLDNLIGKI